MIVKIGGARSGHPGKLINYLFGPGKSHEHRDHHTVAGSVHYPGAGVEIRSQVTADLQMPKTLWPQVDFNGGHIYHCTLAIGAGEGQLSDEKWERITHEYMQAMKLEDPTKAPMRWTAVRHGVSVEGNDHVHIVANLIREDGTKASIWQDQVRAQKVVAQLEQKHGLVVLQSRLAPVGAGSVPYTEREVIEARKAGKPVDRVELERHVRAAATAAQTEAQFVGLMRSSGLAIKPYPPTAGPVKGYSVALAGPDGKPSGRFYAGGELARDLTLPRVRALWPDAGGSAAAALDQWRPTVGAAPAVVPSPTLSPADLEAAERALQGLDVDLQLAGPQEFAELSQDLAGAAAAAAAVAPQESRAELARVSREVGGWAGSTRSIKRLGPSRTQFVALALLHSLKPGSELSSAFVQRQLITLIIQLVQSHRAARPVAFSPGRGVSMSQAADDLDNMANGVINTMVTTASVLSERNRRAATVVAARRAPGRFHRFATALDDPRLPRDPVPVGFRGVIAPADWAALQSDQRMELDPDRIGRWLTDIDPTRPETGAALPSTQTQVILGGRLGEALGEPGRGGEIAALSRGMAAQQIRRMEARLTPSEVRDLYHDSGLAYRTVGKDGVSYEMLDGTRFPIPETPAMAPKVSAGRVAQHGQKAPSGPAPRPENWLDRPDEWHTGNEPVTTAQAYRLHMLGVPDDQIDQLDKGWASAVIGGYGRSPEDGQNALDRALAAGVRSGVLPVQGNSPKAQQPQHKGPTR